MDVNFAKKATAGTALGLSIGALGLEVLRGGIGGLFNGAGTNQECGKSGGDGATLAAVIAAMSLANNAKSSAYPCVEGIPVNRYEFGLQKEITNKDMEIAYLKGRDAAKTDSIELYRYVDGKFNAIEGQIAAQAVVNAQITANISCMQNSIAALNGLTKTVIPIGNVCPEPMQRYNSWTAPTATDTAAG